MTELFNNIDFGKLLRIIRDKTNLTQNEFAERIGKKRKWISYKETNTRKMYINDFINLINFYNFDISILSIKDGRKINLREYKPNEILKVLREWSNLTIEEFANTIGKKRTWQISNESGKTNFYANDLFDLVCKNGFEIELCYKGDVYED